MISIILQLYGSTFLVWTALNKSRLTRADEIRLVVPGNIKISKKEAEMKQREYYLNIAGFVLISIGYLMQLFNIDFDVLACLVPLLAISALIVGFLLILSIIFFVAKASGRSFFLYAKHNVRKGKSYLWMSGEQVERTPQYQGADKEGEQE